MSICSSFRSQMESRAHVDANRTHPQTHPFGLTGGHDSDQDGPTNESFIFLLNWKNEPCAKPSPPARFLHF